jgi:hypothetical protein
LKVLPEAFVEDRERLVRFEREAQILALLSEHVAVGAVTVVRSWQAALPDSH